MTTKIDTYMELTKEVHRVSSELHKFVHENIHDLVHDIAMELKTIPGMNKVIVKGYTPGFNDGDPCTHSSDVYYNKKWHFSELSEYGIGGLAEFFGAPEEYEDEEEELYNWEGIDTINTYSDEDEQKIHDLVSLLDDLIERKYYTDYIVFIDLTGDEPVIKHEDYDCGY
ncbi:hypothetical protein DQT32_05015 [Salmonella enterica subsp. enterica serovar Braenderup]|nr:hypothetical protein [Salmonella enterica subsp. enterica serovar Braenderup]